MQNIDSLEQDMIKFSDIFSTPVSKTRTLMDTNERYGLNETKNYGLYQYINYLKGLQLEYECGDFYAAKHFYMKSLTEAAYVDNRIRFKTINRLVSIDNRIGKISFKSSPYYSLMSRYYIKEKYVQVLFDASSFTNIKVLQNTFDLARGIYRDLNKQDYFGLKILKNGFDQTKNKEAANDDDNDKDKVILTQKPRQYLEDVLCLELKELNQDFKFKHLLDYKNNKIKSIICKNMNKTIDQKDVALQKKEMMNQTTNAFKTTIDSINNIPNYNVKKEFGSEIKGPFKWVIIFLGPHNLARDVRKLTEDSKEYGLNLNIIIILINNSTRRMRRKTTNDEDAGKEENETQRIDAYTKTLIKLCKSTPEGFFLQIDDKHDLYQQ